jgi:glycosyltransferase involved in cell wall biosynthesis
MNCPKVSIICVTKNASQYLERCLKSISEQTCPHIELIVQDGESTDNTLDIIRRWSALINSWQSIPDQGIYDAMNKALEYVTGDWVYFIGSDDYLYPGFSDMVVNDLKHKNRIYYGKVEVGNGTYTRRFSSYKLTKYNLCHQAMFFPRSVFERYRFDLHYEVCADYLLNMQLNCDNRYKFQYVDKLIAFFNDTGFSAVRQDELFEKEKTALVKRYFNRIDYLRYLYRHAHREG